jgi:hypothetical protein
MQLKDIMLSEEARLRKTKAAYFSHMLEIGTIQIQVVL